MSIMEYLGRLKGIVDQLGVAGYVVSDKEKVQQTLSGLGPDFYAFTTALEVLPILPTFNELQGKLLQHEMNMKQLMRGTNQGNAHNVLVMEVAAGHRKGNGAHQEGMNRGHDEQTGKVGAHPPPSGFPLPPLFEAERGKLERRLELPLKALEGLSRSLWGPVQVEPGFGPNSGPYRAIQGHMGSDPDPQYLNAPFRPCLDSMLPPNLDLTQFLPSFENGSDLGTPINHVQAWVPSPRPPPEPPP
ncbi:hypothetical protein EJ110_NYTH33938 [Nymphaea thermarum]|nr:hypothetical protein EJ110_NYTH33938 [Nymphaea thermarum]